MAFNKRKRLYSQVCLMQGANYNFGKTDFMLNKARRFACGKNKRNNMMAFCCVCVKLCDLKRQYCVKLFFLSFTSFYNVIPTSKTYLEGGFDSFMND